MKFRPCLFLSEIAARFQFDGCFLNANECNVNPSEIVKDISYAQGPLKKHFQENGGKIPKNNITTDGIANDYMQKFSKIDRNTLTQEEKNVHDAMNSMLADIDANNGIPIKNDTSTPQNTPRSFSLFQ